MFTKSYNFLIFEQNFTGPLIDKCPILKVSEKAWLI
jgi:hypothetical protein